MIHDPFGRVSIPETVCELRQELLRAERLRRFVAFASRLSVSPNDDDREYGQTLLAWAQHGGDLAKKLRIKGPKGKHRLRIDHVHEDSAAALL